MPQRHRGRARLHRVLPSINEVHLLSQAVQQFSPRADIGLWHETQGALVLSRSLPASTKCCGTTASSRRIPDDELGVPGTLGVEGQSCIVVAARGEQRVDDLGVNRRLSLRRDGRLNRHSRHLMAESKIIPVFDQQAVADQLIHDKRIIHQRHQKPGLHPGTDQHSHVKRLTRRRT